MLDAAFCLIVDWAAAGIGAGLGRERKGSIGFGAGLEVFGGAEILVLTFERAETARLELIVEGAAIGALVDLIWGFGFCTASLFFT